MIRLPESGRIAVPGSHDAERSSEGAAGDEADPARGGCRRHPSRDQQELDRPNARR